jgi:DNA invertase Pin-like site-specific DNA recombinase
MTVNFVAYFREHGIAPNLEAQRTAVEALLKGGELVGEFIEPDTRRMNDRPQLAAAIAQCQADGCTLVVATLGRLTRDTKFLTTLARETDDPYRGVIFCDLPLLESGSLGQFMATQMILLAKVESAVVSQQTKAALQARKARGITLRGFKGHKVDYRLASAARSKKADQFAHSLAPAIVPLVRQRLSLHQIAIKLTEQGIATANGGKWTAATVSNVIDRIRNMSRMRSGRSE